MQRLLPSSLTGVKDIVAGAVLVIRMSKINLQISLYYLKKSLVNIAVTILRIIMRLLPFSILGRLLAISYPGSLLLEFVTIGLAFSATLDDSLTSPLRSWRQKGILENHMVSKLGIRGALLSYLVFSCLKGEFIFAAILTIGGLINIELFPSGKTLFSLLLLVPSITVTGFGIVLMSMGYHLKTQKIVPVPLYLRFVTWIFGEVFFPLEKISPALSSFGQFVPTIFLVRTLREVYTGTLISSEILLRITQTYMLGLLFLTIGFLAVSKGLEEARTQGTTTRIFLGV